MGDLGDIVEQFATDNDYFLEQYAKTYNYLITANTFDVQDLPRTDARASAIPPSEDKPHRSSPPQLLLLLVYEVDKTMKKERLTMKLMYSTYCNIFTANA